MKGAAIHILAAPREQIAAAWLRRDLGAFLALLRVKGPLELSVTLTSDRGIAALNRRHRALDEPTDVLSFPQTAAPGPRRVLGDLIISMQTARREAAARGVPLREELRRYAAHGLLHLLGHDHEESGDARRMARMESKLLRGQGLIDGASNDIGSRRASARR